MTKFEIPSTAELDRKLLELLHKAGPLGADVMPIARRGFGSGHVSLRRAIKSRLTELVRAGVVGYTSAGRYVLRPTEPNGARGPQFEPTFTRRG